MAVVTISRQYGTGGIFIAHQLADKLGHAFLGRDELVEICEQRGLTLDLDKIEGRAPKSSTLWRRETLERFRVRSEWQRDKVNVVSADGVGVSTS